MVTRLLHGFAFVALSLFAAFSIFTALPVFPASAQVLGEKVTLVFDRALPNVPGKSMKVQVVEYEPGVSSIPHTHAASAFIYATVLEGAIRSKINDNPAQVYHAGENFFELPGDHHRVSANASDTEPARLLAVLIANTDEQNLVINEE
ncbi:cupin domain-containing protein [Phormidium sp. FACHB-592]|uniref:Cupin domain-containing protein n=1 Tax=Stenomitos frigidus AS-A4 TaxID=2933935 RepID=A0ABV0KPU8_9CYAN|nr:cupin domain-containing protein [Phormidium sp. FACHB-592]MBD2074268.1 cupin domain-containing protein [Phormidium sp. FACHB-592]